MARKRVPRRVKAFIRWAQKDRCLLCPFPLAFSCQLHHIIAEKDGGPDLPLNLLGLCTNHHLMLHILKATKSPDISKLGTDDRLTNKYIYKVELALEQFDRLEEKLKKALNTLLEPYWTSDDSSTHIFKGTKVSIILPLARRVIQRDTELLNRINNLRPRIFFPKPMLVFTSGKGDPYDMLSLEDKGTQNAIDEFVERELNKIGDEVFDTTISGHLLKLGLEGSFDESEQSVTFHFPHDRFHSVSEIRGMSDAELYSI